MTNSSEVVEAVEQLLDDGKTSAARALLMRCTSSEVSHSVRSHLHRLIDAAASHDIVGA